MSWTRIPGRSSGSRSLHTDASDELADWSRQRFADRFLKFFKASSKAPVPSGCTVQPTARCFPQDAHICRRLYADQSRAKGRRVSTSVYSFPRFARISEQMPLRQATTTTPMARITTVRLNAFIGLLQGYRPCSSSSAPWRVSTGMAAFLPGHSVTRALPGRLQATRHPCRRWVTCCLYVLIW